MSNETRRNGAESCWEAFRWWIYCAYFKVDLLIPSFYSIPLQGIEQHGQFEYLYASGAGQWFYEEKVTD